MARMGVFIILFLAAGAGILWLGSRVLTFERVAASVQWVQNQPMSAVLFIALHTGIAAIKPTVLLPIASGTLFGFWNGLALTAFSSNLAAWIGYCAGRLLGRHRLPAVLGESASEGIKKGEFLAILLIRLAGFPPFLITNLSCGLFGFPLYRFALATFVGTLPWLCAATYFADRVWQEAMIHGQKGLLQAWSRYFLPITLIGLVLLGVGAARLFWDKGRGRIKPHGPIV